MLNCLQMGCVGVEFAAIRKCDEDLLDPGGQPAPAGVSLQASTNACAS
jgi:hypothetical protein